MNNVEYQTKMLMREIKKCNQYNQYQRLRKKVSKNADLYQRMNQFRKRSFIMQNEENYDPGAIDRLWDEYQDVLVLPEVREFLASERSLCLMMQNIHQLLNDAIDFDLDFMEEE